MSSKDPCADDPDSTVAGGRVPIILGVTGHRGIPEDDDRIRAVVAGELQKLKHAYPDSPFVILSALAEGADRIVAQIATDEIGAELIAVLPLSIEDYKKDFQTKASKTRFDRMLAASGAVICPSDELTPDRSGKAPRGRDARYAWAGAYIAEYSQILIALWDGAPARGTGGTAEVVDWFSHGFAPEKYSVLRRNTNPLDRPDAGLLVHINPKSQGVESRKPAPANDRITQILERINRFNRDIGQIKAQMPSTWGGVKKTSGLIPADAFPQAEALLGEIRRLVLPYSAADTLSLYYNSLRVRTEYALYAAIALTLIAYALIDLHAISSLFYLLFFLMTYVSIKVVRNHSIDNRYHEYRSLAEALRILFFWRLSGIGEVAWTKYLQKHTGLLSWVRHGVRNLELLHDARVGAPDPDADRAAGLKIARDHWIDAQARFFTNRIETYRSANRFWRGISNTFFFTSFLATAALAGFVVLHLAGTQFIEPDRLGLKFDVAVDLFQVTIGLFAAIAIAAEGFKIRKAYSDLEKQYSMTLQMFKTAQQRLDSKDWNYDAILTQLGTEALIENGEWLWLKSRLPIEMPK